MSRAIYYPTSWHERWIEDEENSFGIRNSSTLLVSYGFSGSI